jgi:hypothetical protein
MGCYTVQSSRSSPTRLLCCATSRMVAGSSPDMVIEFCCWPNPSSHTMVLDFAHCQDICLGSRVWLAREADNFAAICEPIV